MSYISLYLVEEYDITSRFPTFLACLSCDRVWSVRFGHPHTFKVFLLLHCSAFICFVIVPRGAAVCCRSNFSQSWIMPRSSRLLLFTRRCHIGWCCERVRYHGPESAECLGMSMIGLYTVSVTPNGDRRSRVYAASCTKTIHQLPPTLSYVGLVHHGPLIWS